MYRTRDRYRVRPNRRGYISAVYHTIFTQWLGATAIEYWPNRCRYCGDDHRRCAGSQFKTVWIALKMVRDAPHLDALGC
jgi:hypothetical protein